MTSMEGTTGRGRTADAGERNLAQWFCLVIGAVLVAVGVLGFFVDSTFNVGEGIGGDELIVFEVNGWHNVVHLATGVFLLAMAPTRTTARTGAIAFGLVYALVTVIGFIDGSDVLNFIPVNTADNFLHLALAALALVAGFAPDGADRDRTTRRERVEETGTATTAPTRTTRVGR